MNAIKLIAILFALLLAACGTSRAQVEDWTEVADQLTDSRHVEATTFALQQANGSEQSGATWISLCDRKECSAEAVDYSRVFRESALLAEAVRQAGILTQSGHGDVIRLDSERIAELSQRITVLKMEVDWMTPESDLDPSVQEMARRGAALAKEQLAFAAKNVSFLSESTTRGVEVAVAD